jgi:hypothetical protein
VSDTRTPLETKALELLVCLVDSDDCWFDHHGGCQAHGYLSLAPGEICPVRETKDLLDEHGVEWRS